MKKNHFIINPRYWNPSWTLSRYKCVVFSMNQSLSLCCQIVFTLRQQSGKRQIHKNCRTANGTAVCSDSLPLPKNDIYVTTKQHCEERKIQKINKNAFWDIFAFLRSSWKKVFWNENNFVKKKRMKNEWNR